MEIKSEISNLASNFLNKNFSIKTDYIEIQNTKKDFVGKAWKKFSGIIDIIEPHSFKRHCQGFHLQFS